MSNTVYDKSMQMPAAINNNDIVHCNQIGLVALRVTDGYFRIRENRTFVRSQMIARQWIYWTSLLPTQLSTTRNLKRAAWVISQSACLGFISFRFSYQLSILALHFIIDLFWHVRGFGPLPFTINIKQTLIRATVTARQLWTLIYTDENVHYVQIVDE